MDITKQRSEALKGIALLLMFAHHLFGLPSLVSPPSYWMPVVPGVPLEYLLGRYGKVCVPLFLLLSGYGIALSGRVAWRDTWRRLGRFFATYWIYFVLLVGIGVAFFPEMMTGRGPRFSTEPFRLIANALALRHDYAYEWWFAEVYVLLVVLSPVLLACTRRPRLLLAGSVLTFLLGAALDGAGLRLPVLTPANLLIWQLPFVMGLLLARDGARLPLACRPLPAAALVVIGTLVIERVLPRAMAPWLIVSVPLSLVMLDALAARAGRLGAALAVLGQRALPLWLVHPFLCYYFAQRLIYAPVWSPLVFLNLLALTLVIVLGVEALRKGLTGIHSRLSPG